MNRSLRSILPIWTLGWRALDVNLRESLSCLRTDVFFIKSPDKHLKTASSRTRRKRADCRNRFLRATSQISLSYRLYECVLSTRFEYLDQRRRHQIDRGLPANLRCLVPSRYDLEHRRRRTRRSSYRPSAQPPRSGSKDRLNWLRQEGDKQLESSER
jgi:hypothetical protein